MTDKRFTLHKGVDTLNIMDNTKFHEHIYINKSNKDMELLVKVLNTLHEENQSSKEFIEQLQEELVLFKKAGADMGIDLNAQITALKQENEELKQEIKELNLKMIRDLNDFLRK